MVGPLGAQTDTGSVRKPDATLLGLFGRDLQPLTPPDPLDPLVVDDPCDRKSSGEEDEHEVLKPFGAIQRVQLPPGKGQPTSRKRALHGVRQRPS